MPLYKRAIAEFFGKTFGNGVDAALGRGVRHPVNRAHRHRSNVDDRSAAARSHMRNHRPASPQGRPQRAADFLLDLMLLVFIKRLGPNRAADVVDRDYSLCQGRRLAEEICDHRRAQPGVPITLVGYSAGSAVALAGIHMSPIPELDYDRLLFNERDLHPVTANTRDDARQLSNAAASRSSPVRSTA